MLAAAMTAAAPTPPHAKAGQPAAAAAGSPGADAAPRPGLLVLHGNRLEELAEVVFGWLARHPLAPLEEEVFLVPSNGMAEWLKMTLAAQAGICAAARVELPARFLWRAYRAALGRASVPQALPLDELPLTWRLMRLLGALERGEPTALPAQLGGPLRGFLRPGDALRRHQLAMRLADLFDQYQVYRADWLADWAGGTDRLRRPAGATPVPAEQRWQPALWRAVLAGLTPAEREATRARLHERFMHAVRGGAAAPVLPRRIVIFGTTHLPLPTLEALAALSAHSQVLMAVPNPCRWHWADLIDGRELLRAARRRHALRGGVDPANLPDHELHTQGHPLLAAWGRQSRDFVRLLDEFDDAEAARARFALERIDHFDLSAPGTLLQQVHAAIRESTPLAEHAAVARPVANEDRSLVFHIAHSAQREVEILHDQLLQLLLQQAPPSAAQTGGPSGPAARPLAPRDIVVMVPDIDAFAPAIRSVFGQHDRGDARHIPWGIADQRDRHRHPLLAALDGLLHASDKRFTASELHDLLELPAVARRFGVTAEELPLATAWAEGAAARWGLDAAQRAGLGLAACGEPTTWRFAVDRMLMGYAAGALPVGAELPLGGIEPFAEVAGLEAHLAGRLDGLVQALQRWWAEQGVPRSPAAWALRLRALLGEFFAPTDEAERALLAALDAALADWLLACEAASFEEALDIAVVREAWLAALQSPGDARRFKAGGVTFCTLLPLRAIPFEVVCLLGMNEGDYPRRPVRDDFDLLAEPGQARPGDRSRRDDDRQLMLDALLAARRVLYVSWAGRNPRDNSEQPPSVLVAQLRDYLAAGWGTEVVAARTTVHPLQPFGRGYFERPKAGQPALFTYAAEWRGAHGAPAGRAAQAAAGPKGALVAGAAAAAAAAVMAPAQWPPPGPTPHAAPITVADLVRFLRNPVKEFFRHRLQVRFDEIAEPPPDDEDFISAGLPRWRQCDEVLQALRPQFAQGADGMGEPGGALVQRVEAEVARLQRAGRLPLGGPAGHTARELVATLAPMLAEWQRTLSSLPQQLPPQWLEFADAHAAGLALRERLRDLRGEAGEGASGGAVVWVHLVAGRLAHKPPAKKRGTQGSPEEGAELRLREDKLLAQWVVGLAAAAAGWELTSIVIGADAVVCCQPILPAQAPAARATLAALLGARAEGLAAAEPWPSAVRTGLAWLASPDAAAATYEGGFQRRGESEEPCLMRLAPDFAALRVRPGFEAATARLYAPYAQWLGEHVAAPRALPGHAELAESGDE